MGSGSREGAKWNFMPFQQLAKIVPGCADIGFALWSAVAETLGKITE